MIEGVENMKRLTRYVGLIAGASLLTAGLAGCAPPITEGTAKAMIERCKELGMATRVFHGMSSTVDCVEVKHVAG